MIYLSMMGLRCIGVELFSVCTQLQTVDELMESASTLPGSSLGRELNFFPDKGEWRFNRQQNRLNG